MDNNLAHLCLHTFKMPKREFDKLSTGEKAWYLASLNKDYEEKERVKRDLDRKARK